jgi:hypothetical protein
MLASAHDGGVNHHLFVVVIAGQEPENPLDSAALGPAVEALMDRSSNRQSAQADRAKECRLET